MSARRAQRKDSRRHERTARWESAARAAKWTDPDVEPPASAWGRWTPPARWRANHAQVMAFTRSQLTLVANVFAKGIGSTGAEIVTVVPMAGPTALGGEP